MTPPSPARRVRGRPARVAGAVTALLAGLAGMVVAPPAAAAQGADGNRPVVVLGAAGLQWSDLDPAVTPALWGLVDDSALGSVSVRSTRSATCPVDGWLTLGAGRRAAAPVPQPPPETPDDGVTPYCLPVPVPDPAGDAAVVPGFDELVAHNDELAYDARLGLLGQQVRAGGGCATAVGPGSALALAEPDGSVPNYRAAGATLAPSDLKRCGLAVVDLGSAVTPGFVARADPAEDTGADGGTGAAGGSEPPGAAGVPPARGAQVAAVDAAAGRVLDAVPAGTTVLLAGVADAGSTPHLAVGAVRADGFGDGWLETRSTRRVGLAQLTDLAPTVLTLLGLPAPDGAVGSPVSSGGPRPPTAEAVAVLVELDTAAHVQRSFLQPFFVGLVLAQLALYGGAAVALRRRRGGWESRLRVLRATRGAAIVFAAVPVATFLANLVPWWRTGAPLAVLLLAVGVAVAAVTAVALGGPWRHQVLGPVGAVATVTAVVLGLDVLTGSRLQLSSLMGYNPLVAGRFYGFGNQAFAVFASGALLATAALVQPWVRRGRRRRAVAAVTVVGVTAVVLVGTPRWGSDFGGVIALVPGFAVLGLGVAGRRVSLLSSVLIAAGAAAAITAISVLDWLRPPAERSHLGLFVQQVLDGEALVVVGRKLSANIGTLTVNELTLLVPFALAFLVIVLMRPRQWRAAALYSAYERAPLLRAGLNSAAVALLVGFAVNDSGIAIPAVGLTIVIPLALAASVAAVERDEAADVSGGAGGPEDRDAVADPPARTAGPAAR